MRFELVVWASEFGEKKRSNRIFRVGCAYPLKHEREKSMSEIVTGVQCHSSVGGEMPRDAMGAAEIAGDRSGESCHSNAQEICEDDSSWVRSGDITLKHDEGMVTVDWKTAPDGYDVILCQGDREMTRQPVINPPTSFPTASWSAGTYCVKVKVRGSDRPDPPATRCEPCLVKLPAPSNIAFFYDGTAEKLRVTWDEVTGATNYRVEIVQVFNPEAPLADRNVYELEISALDGQTTTYQAWVQAKGDERHIDSNIGKSAATLSPLPAPQNVTQSYKVTASEPRERKELRARWEAVENAIGYRIHVVNLDTQEVIAQQVLNDGTQTTHTFDAHGFVTGSAGDYQVWVKARGNDRYLDSAFAPAQTSMPRLAAPKGVKQFSDIEAEGDPSGELDRQQRTLLMAEFKEVPKAVGYWAQVVKVDDNGNSIEVVADLWEARFPDSVSEEAGRLQRVYFQTHNFTDTEVVQYQIWVKARGDDRTLDSAFARATPLVTRLPAPTNIALGNTTTALSASWDAVPQASKYDTQAVNIDADTNGAIVRQQSVVLPPEGQSPSVSFDTESFTTEQTAKYQIWVKAVSNDDRTLDSAFGKPQGSIPLAKIPREPETLEGGGSNDAFPR
jgi:hypothetical protein